MLGALEEGETSCSGWVFLTHHCPVLLHTKNRRTFGEVMDLLHSLVATASTGDINSEGVGSDVAPATG